MGKVVFIHPDLGIGGAERAVIDAALALKSRGHQVQFVTAHHDPTHSFQETKDGSLRVTVVGDWLPRKILGRFYALCAYVRMVYAAIYLTFFSAIQHDVIFCDQISACIPIFKMRSSETKIIFYCHFPDMLLTQRKSFWKRIYRAPLDWLEEKTTGMANTVLVNSKFTAGVFHETFRSLGHIEPQVLYPIPDFSAFDKPVDPPNSVLMPIKAKITFLSINRYERKKNLELALYALDNLLKRKADADVHLIIAGGYDTRVNENVEYYAKLVSLAEELGLINDQDHHVTFLRSLSDSHKRTLLKFCSCLIYTPDREHFGIVPLEAMYMKCPVIAMRSGGPLETVGDGTTGFLCNNKAEDVASAMLKFVNDPDLAKSFGQAGKIRVENVFSFVRFTEKLDTMVHELIVNK